MSATVSPPRGSQWMTDEMSMLRELAQAFFEREAVPHYERWAEQQHVDRDFWRKAGEVGLLCASIPEQYGGGGGTFGHDVVINEEQARTLDGGFGNYVHSTICAHYILSYGTEEQKDRWLPGMASGELVCGIAMTEPGAGSDLLGIKTAAVRHGHEYMISGAKTFISNGINADLMITVAKTDRDQGDRGISLLVVETDRAGYSRGRVLEKIGIKDQDTVELFYEDVRVPAANLLGGVEGQGFAQLMTQLPQERLCIAVTAVAAMERVLELTIQYTKERTAFGRELLRFQNTRFELAECATEVRIARVFLDDCIRRHIAGELDAATASMAKWWTTETQCRVVDRCLQLFGGYGYMLEYPVARAYADARVQKIYGGTNEIMKLLIARTL
jgi:long-chain-acyl-CoA dehydrogenase